MTGRCHLWSRAVLGRSIVTPAFLARMGLTKRCCVAHLASSPPPLCRRRWAACVQASSPRQPTLSRRWWQPSRSAACLLALECVMLPLAALICSLAHVLLASWPVCRTQPVAIAAGGRPITAPALVLSVCPALRPSHFLLAQRIIDNGHGYAVGSDVFFDVASLPGYGKLSGRSQVCAAVACSAAAGQ